MLLASSLQQTTQALHANSLLDKEETTKAHDRGVVAVNGIGASNRGN